MSRLRDLTGMDQAGTSMQRLLHAAESLGFSARGVRGPFDALTNIPLPAIAHVNNDERLGHFVVLYRAHKNWVVVGDPTGKVQKLSRDQFNEMWTGNLLLVSATPGHVAAHATAGRWSRFFSLLLGHRSILVEACCCATLMTLLGLTTSYFIQHLVDSVLVRGDGQLLRALGTGMMLIILFRVLFSLLRHYLLAHIGRKIDLSLISNFSRHTLRLPLRFFEMRQVGEIISRVTDAAKIREAVSGATLTAVGDSFMIVISLVALWIYDAPLAMVATAFAPLLAVSVIAHQPLVKRRSREAMERAAQLAAHLIENISGVETVKAYGIERQRSDENESKLVDLAQTSFSMEKLGMSMSGASLALTEIAGIVVLWYGSHRVMAGALTIGQLMFFYTLLGYLLRPLERLAGLNLQIQDALIAVDRLYEIMDEQAEQLEDARKAQFDGVRESIEHNP